MIRLPAAIYLMGGDGLENSPPHEAIVAAFDLDAREVTVGDYEACVKAGRCGAPRMDNPFCNPLTAERAKHPINCVTYTDAETFCAFSKKRLPTEEEWEYAARGGTERRLYSWGNEEPDSKRACYAHEGTCEVGSFAPGAFGLFDMTGNVWEWTSTTFALYGTAPATPRPGTTELKVYRGGSWSRRFAKWMRNDLRNRYQTNEASASLGIRCARTTSPLECTADAKPNAVGDGCVRAKGDVLCPAGQIHKDGRCRVDVEGVRLSGLTSPLPSGSITPSDPRALEREPPMKVRNASVDADCAKYPGLPAGYTFRGGAFGVREALVAGSGCKKRDIGVGWTSVCCPS